eukprot:TRINITY_DN16463_c0_g1_i1.p1 TRINITY_DN16463_c0_g1~~TRINITY_DN16463_c0_g1_i1.p1  ORF type:complete len:237 (-),score=31.10 TRINITY_DN16463_c0_g1_i1:89-799(-)
MTDLARSTVIGSVGLLAKIFLRLCTSLEVRNLSQLVEAASHRSAGRSLITVSNHTSTLDDPVLWGILPCSILFDANRMRWSLGAEELLFTTRFTRWFFRLGKVLATRRGDGIYQPSVNKALELLEAGDWIHVFPEGKVIQDSSQLKTRLKWGVGRLIMESKTPPLILPIVHQGLEQIKPIDKWVRPFRPLLVKIGDVVDTGPLREKLYQSDLPPDEQRSQATAFVAAQMAKLYHQS